MIVIKFHVGKDVDLKKKNVTYCITGNYHPQDQLKYCASKMAKITYL